MIVPRLRRDEVIGRLRRKVESRIPIFIASAGSGLVAKLLENAGVDCVNTFSGARLRANGMGTMSMMWPILDSNRQTLDYTEQDILPAMTGDAFVCACLNANDPLRDMHSVLERLKAMCAALRNNHHSRIFRRQNFAMPFEIGLGFTPQINEHIEGPPPQAPYKLHLRIRSILKMQPSNGTLGDRRRLVDLHNCSSCQH